MEQFGAGAQFMVIFFGAFALAMLLVLAWKSGWLRRGK